jgi:hypothetical protein
LESRQIQLCEDFWEIIGGNEVCPLNVSRAHTDQSKTEFIPSLGIVYLGSDAYPGPSGDARSTMSMQSCLAHELAHAQRHFKGIERPFEMPDYLLEEAEASIHDSFVIALSPSQRSIMILDARDQLDRWLREV